MIQEQEFIDISQQVIRFWRQEKVSLNLGATEEEISLFESRYQLLLPPDFRYFYTQVNGMPDGLTDEWLFSLWPLQDISKHPVGVIQNPTDELHFVQVTFGDYCIDSHRYLLNCDNIGNWSVMAQLEKDTKIADNFTHFLKQYLSSPEDICIW